MPICRPMLLAYPEDHNVNGDQWPQQYMFGEWILVAPVYGDFTSMEIFLPAGSKWIDFWNKEIYNGGGILRYDVTDINKLPLFIKEGAIIPKRQKALWIDPKLPDSLTFEIYPRTDKESVFTLYEDDGISTNYQQGEYSTMQIRCKNSKSQIGIILGALNGSLFNKPKIRSYKVRLFLQEIKPAEIRINNAVINYYKDPLKAGIKGWISKPEEKYIEISTGEISTSQKHVIIVIID